MFDFRYHALSLVAVFVALAVGLLLGVAIGDQGLVSSAENKLRSNLRDDVLKARADAAALRSQLEMHQRYEDQTFGALVADELSGRRIDLLFLGERSETVFNGVRDALSPTGSELRFSSTLRQPLDLTAIAKLAAGTRYETIDQDPGLLGDLGERLGHQLVRGGRLLRVLRPELLSSSSGELGPVEGIVIARTPAADELSHEAAGTSNALVDGMIRGILKTSRAVVGVETTTTQPSQIDWYQGHGLPSVDDVDQTPGRASMVFVLAGAADGHYGEKAGADALLPDALVRTP